ncbi:MAG: serine hydrolase family protein [Gammaproteobacteria bacterium]|nr:serine hydrolase family protein [Betaproteobacteria bacterium]MDH4258774.1 serine hydrolase family protein [Gammaproteobacteria bacterium]
MNKLKILTLHCLGSNPSKHANQQWHFVHCAQACAGLAEWVYPAGPNLLEPDVVQSLLKNDMGCTDEEVQAFGFEEPRCWFRFTDNRYVGLEASMASLAEVCRRERPDGIAGYSNGGGAAQLVAALHEAGHADFQSIRFLMSFAGPTSQMMQRHIREYLGPDHRKIAIPTIIFGSRHDPMLANADQMAADLFERCELATTDETRPYANHALPDKAECYERIVNFVRARLRRDEDGGTLQGA